MAVGLYAAEPASDGTTTPPQTGESTDINLENSVVKIFSTIRYPDVFRPWTKQAPKEITGSGVVIAGHRILTNSHVVLYAGQVQVQASQSGDKITAHVVATSPEMDLAVLELEDDSFFDTHHPLEQAADIPEVKDNVLVYGFPTGGTSLSITKGIVSRIEFTPYIFPASGLRIQIDAAINPGNSGGPAIADNKMIGLAFSHLGKADNIGYIIPNEEIDLFLADIADGHYDGKPGMYDTTQKLQNPALRDYLHLDKDTDGVVVRGIYTEFQDYPLQPWDVITKIESSSIDNEGMITIKPTLRVRFDYLVQKLAHEGKVNLTIVRDGKTQDVQMPVSSHRPVLIRDLKGRYPSYFIFGPVVFSPVTKQMVGGFNRQSTTALTNMGSPIITRSSDMPAFSGEQLVAISSPFFPHRLVKGYWPPVGLVVKTINGIPIKNLLQLVQVLRDSREKFITMDFYRIGAETLVFPREQTIKATEGILEDNDVRSQGSPDAMKVWNAQPAM